MDASVCDERGHMRYLNLRVLRNRPTLPSAIPAQLTMSNETDEVQDLTVTFKPPLYLQRRGWVLDIMRREGVREVHPIRRPVTYASNLSCTHR